MAAWQAQTVSKLLAVPGVVPTVVVRDARAAPSLQPARRLRRLLASPTAAWDAYNNGWVARRARSLARTPSDQVLGGVPILDVVPVVDGWSEYFPDDALRSLRTYRPDVLMRFGFGILRGDILELPRFGVWSFHHDDEELYRGSPPAFWELIDDAPVTGAVLQRLTERLDGGRVLEKGWFRTVRHSYVRNTDSVHLGGTDWPAKLARRLLDGDADAVSAPASRSSAPLFRKPGNAATAKFLAVQGVRAVVAQTSGLFLGDRWDIGVVRAPIHRFLDPMFEPKVQWLGLAGPGVYAADPFPANDVDGLRILYERFSSAARKGALWSAALDDPTDARPEDLPRATHASYPFTFSDGESEFCIPQLDGEPPRLYRLDGAGGWHEAGPLLPSPVLDPTVVRHEGRWYLLATEPGRHSLSKLHLWSADALGGPWRPHPANPVVTDVRCARPGGTPFVHEGRLYRPAQDCSGGYGASVSICEIVELDERRFRQRVVIRRRPADHWPYHSGMHTLSAMGELTLIDARCRVFDRHESKAELGARLRRLRGER